MKNFKIVGHNIFGEGLVLETRWNGTESRVQFRSGLCLWLPTKWLRPIQTEEKELDEISSKRLLEAFRLGVVPHQDIERFTFGRGDEIDYLQQGLRDIKEGQGDVYLIEGAYGSGKTHLLEYLRHRALKEGLVTTYCELHVQETPPYRPKKIYHELVYNLRYLRDGCEYGYRELLRNASKLDIPDHCFFTPVIKRVKEFEDGDLHSEVFWQWIEGESTKDYATDRSSPYRVKAAQAIPALYDFSTAADFYNFLLSGLSYIVHQLALGGLVIIIDELEQIDHVWDYQLKERGMTFFEGLIRTALNDSALKTIDNLMMHNQVRPTPYSYKESYILLILATTPGHESSLLDRIKKRMSLRKFGRLELELIFENLLRVYKSAYKSFSLEPAMADKILAAALKKSEEELRDFIKFSVEAFDWVRFGCKDR